MKNLIFFLLILFCVSIISCNDATPNTVTTNVDTLPIKPISKDNIYQITDSITYYKGKKGGVYYFKLSKKSNKYYKKYVTR